MKKLLVTDTKYLNINLALLVARIAIALLMLLHGIPKMQMLLSGDAGQFPAVFGLSAELSLSLAVFAEVICSVFVLAGFGTRLASVPLIFTMIVAVFSIHAEDVFAKKELAVLYLAVYVVLFVAGSGKYSIDYLLQPQSRKKEQVRFKQDKPGLPAYR
jgi:putative oxidoreductase